MTKLKKLLALIVVSVLLGGLLSACGGEDKSSAGSDKTQLNVAAELISITLDPSKDWDSWFVMRWGVGETLVKFSDDGSFEPWLAESWSLDETNNLKWTIKLKDNVVFSNGEKMTATKVADSIHWLYEQEDPANGGTGNPHGFFTYTALTPDDAANTLVIETTEPTPDLPGCLAYPWMMIIDVEATDERDITTEGPIATGPYAILSSTADVDVQLTKNEYYWDGEVPFETVNVMKVAESATRTMALQDGSADMALSISGSDRGILEADGSYNISTVAGSRVGYAHVNMEGVLSNDALRQAVMMAIDGETIADVTTNQSYLYGYAVIPSNFDFGYDKLTYEFKYDPKAAIALLDEAGIVDGDGDGIREIDGKNIELDYKVTASRQMDIIGQAQASQLEKIGIVANVQVTENQSEVLNNGTFDLAASNEVTTPTGDPKNFLLHWHSENEANYSSYENPQYDEIFEKLTTEFDQETRKEYITQLQQILLDDGAVLVYGYYNYNLCSTKAITGAYCPSSDYYWVTKDIKPAK